ncbi:uncharacterized protein BO66DRAFT_443373 [Aspergillus aculeatinus CBS 121060]|uniref:Uncharacterized protein n=1 Tax=Aspergillus aculeatinus CBS 121060 TaxID=1448322 RepID=A0ACD1GUU8_9EURO|nr:hypothetical protein BO66DRAFT_443373 [Aspergillus aculeatinus CBS 121060]RAH65090.1 hypothetical protein BO66DRAFT_443373 [Aspergillus aculeatinus CBS 121060]
MAAFQLIFRSRLCPWFPEGSSVASPSIALWTTKGRGASFSIPLPALWSAPSRHGYKHLLLNHPPSNPTVLISTQPRLQSTPSDLPLCYLLFSRALERLELRGSSFARSAKSSGHASSEEAQCRQLRNHTDDDTDEDLAQWRVPELQSAMRWQFELETQCGDRPHGPALRAMLEDQKRQVHNLRRRLQDKRRKEMRRDFSRKQAVIDIERQMTGGAANDDPARKALQKEFATPSEQILLVETFFT